MRRPASARALAVPLVIGCLCALLGLGAARSELMAKAEYFLLDVRFVLREALVPRAVPVHRAIRLVLVDDRSFQALIDERSPDKAKRNSVFWMPLYGRLAEALTDAGATIVGFDMLLSCIDRDECRAFMAAAVRNPGKIVLAAYADMDAGPGLPSVVTASSPLAAAVGSLEGQGLANLTRDVDGVERAQMAFPVSLRNNVTGMSETWSFFAPLLAERHSGKKLRPDALAFGGDPLPVLAPPDGRLLVNYAGREGRVFPAYSFHEILARIDKGDAAYLREHFEGAAVIVGYGAKSRQDICETPFTIVDEPPSAGASLLEGPRRRSMPGVEVQAHILNTLLTGAYLKKVAPRDGALALLFACLGAALLTSRASAFAGGVGTAAILALYAVAAWLLFSLRGIWLPLAPAGVALPMVALVMYGWRYRFEERERRRTRNLFGRYVSKDVMEDLLHAAEGAAPGATERREITLLFSDINGFSTVSESRSPEDVMVMLNEYFSAMTALIFQEKGTIKQFVGDEIMVMYGAPRPHPEHAMAAVRTALKMLERLDALAAADPQGGRGFYHVKIGIHTGEVILGNVGAAERMEYAAVGDNVNLASRIMGMTKSVGARLLVSEVTYREVKGMAGVEFISHGTRAVKGRKEEIEIFEVRPVTQ